METIVVVRDAGGLVKYTETRVRGDGAIVEPLLTSEGQNPGGTNQVFRHVLSVYRSVQVDSNGYGSQGARRTIAQFTDWVSWELVDDE